MNQPQGDMASTKEDIVASQTVESKRVGDTRRSRPGSGRGTGCAGISAAFEVAVTLVPSGAGC
jgi:hypothetical protein